MAETRPPFEDDKIYYWGQYVAAVVAETLEQAKAAANCGSRGIRGRNA